MDQAKPFQGVRPAAEADIGDLAVIDLGRASEETRGVCGVFEDVVFHLIEVGLEPD